MSKIAISYNSLDNAASEAKGVATKLNAYANSLEWSVQRKFGNYDGEWTDNVSTAYTSITNKMNDLRDLSSDYTIYAEGLTALKAECKRTDTAVRGKVQELVGDFKELHGIRDSAIENAISYYITKFDNSAGWLRQGSDFINDVAAKADGLFDTIEEWYDYKGGKEWIVNSLVAVLEVVGAVLAVATAVGALFAASTIGAVIVALAGIVGGVIAGFNGFVNLINEQGAFIETCFKDEPANGVRKSNLNTIQDNLRTTDNRALHHLAATIDGVVFVCGVIDFVDSLSSFAKKGHKWLTGNEKALDNITAKDIFSKDTVDGAKGKLNVFKESIVNEGKEIRMAIKNGKFPDIDIAEVKSGMKNAGTDFMNNMKGHYLDFSTKDKSLSSAKSINSTIKGFAKDGISFETVTKTLAPGLGETNLFVYDSEKETGQMYFDYEDYSINDGIGLVFDTIGLFGDGKQLLDNTMFERNAKYENKTWFEYVSVVDVSSSVNFYPDTSGIAYSSSNSNYPQIAIAS